MKKFLYISIIFALLLNLLSISKVLSYELADPNDIFAVSSPVPNQVAVGNINISISSYDNEQTLIPFTAQLYDGGTCQNTFYGSVTSQQTLPSNASSANNISWNTRSTTTNANLADGSYCLRICLSLVDGGAPYSACNSRIIRLANNNRAPVITSTPQGTSIFENGTWQYQMQANDPDGNALAYRLNVAPIFLSINSSNGLIQTNGNPRTLAAGVNRADYQVIASVEDGLGGVATQQFTFSIVRQAQVTSPQPVPPPPSNNSNNNQNNNNNDDEDDENVNQSSTIEINFPRENSILKGENNLVKWAINDPDGIESITLSYSQDAENWTELANFDGSTSEFNWNVTELEDGVYYLQFTVKDSKNSSISKRSSRFNILNNSEGDNVSRPLIVNVKPEKDTSVSGVDSISGDFVASEGNTIKPETFYIEVDGEDFTERCEVNETGFICNLGENRISEPGQHSINVSIEDTSSQKSEEQWNFDIFAQPGQEDEEGGSEDDKLILAGREIARSTLILLVLVCCLSSILLTVPWVLYSMWRRDEDNDDYYKDETDTTTNLTTTYVPPVTTSTTTESLYTPVTPSVTANYYVPDYTNLYNTPTVTPEVTQPTPEITVNTSTYTMPTMPVEPVVSTEPVQQPTTEVTTNTFTYDPNIPLNIPTVPTQPTADQSQQGNNNGYYEPTPTS